MAQVEGPVTHCYAARPPKKLALDVLTVCCTRLLRARIIGLAFMPCADALHKLLELVEYFWCVSSDED